MPRRPFTMRMLPAAVLGAAMLAALPAGASDPVGVAAKGGFPEYLFLEKLPRAEAEVMAKKLARAVVAARMIIFAHGAKITDPKLGDKGFFYHSNEGLEVVGIAEVCALAHPDTTTDDPRWECVDIRAVCDMPKPVSLKDVKANPKLKDMALVTSMRLSVQPVTRDEWLEVCRMGGLDTPPMADD